MPGLIDKLGDNKVAVRQANGKLLAVLMDVLQPAVVLDALSPAFMHGNWKVREAAVNIFIQVQTPLPSIPSNHCQAVQLSGYGSLQHRFVAQSWKQDRGHQTTTASVALPREPSQS